MLDKIALALVIIGALVWGGIGIFGFDVVAWIFGGQGAIVSRIIYTLVAIAGLWSSRCFSAKTKLWIDKNSRCKMQITRPIQTEKHICIHNMQNAAYLVQAASVFMGTSAKLLFCGSPFLR